MAKSPALSNFLRSSTIHGFKYLGKRSSIIEKLFWVILIFVAALVFFLLISETTSKFMTEQIVSKLSKRQYSIREVPFPSVTICPELNLSRDFPGDLNRSRYSEHELDLLQVVNLVYDQNYFTENVSRSTENFMSSLFNHSQIDRLVNDIRAEWRYRYIVPWNLILTKWGFCLNFNLIASEALFNLTEVSPDFHYKHFTYSSELKFQYTKLIADHPWRCKNNRDGLRVKLFKNRRLNYIDSNPLQPFNGYRIIVHKHDELPSSSDTQLFNENFQSLYVEVTPELTLIDDEIRKLSIEKRNCLLSNEKKLKYFNQYTQRNCEQECLSLAIGRECGCVPFFLIRGPRDKICDGFDKHCAMSLVNSFDATGKCNCLDLCESIRFSSIVKTFTYRSSTLLVNFEKNFFYSMVRYRSFGLPEYVAAFGGLMGLIGGLSVMSVIELFFFLSATFSAFLLKRRSTVNPDIENIEPRPTKRKFLTNENSSWIKYKSFFKEFINRNGIHGLSFVMSKRSFYERAFWGFAVFLSLVSCMFLVKNKVKNAEHNPISFDVDVKFWDVEEIPFPAITYCPDFDIEKLYSYLDCFEDNFCENEEEKKWEEMKAVSFFCTKRLHLDLVDRSPDFDFPNDTYITQLERFTRYDWIKNQSFCADNRFGVKVTKIITRSGLCFTFNAHKSVYRRDTVSDGYSSDETLTTSCRHPPEAAPSRNFHMELSDHRRYRCQSALGNIFVHNGKEPPLTSFGKLIPSQATRLVIKPQIVTTDESLRRFDPKIRNCYFEDERPLMLYKIYTLNNCINECQFNWSKAICGCSTFDGIRDKNLTICNYKMFNCAFKIQLGVRLNEDRAEVKSCGCLPDCNVISYSVDTITNWFDPGNSSKYFFATSATIFFSDSEYIAYRRFASFEFVDLLSNIGGLLGLFLGMSFLSVIETIYFFTFRLFVDLWLKR